jgi:hypothetical protein
VALAEIGPAIVERTRSVRVKPFGGVATAVPTPKARMTTTNIPRRCLLMTNPPRRKRQRMLTTFFLKMLAD